MSVRGHICEVGLKFKVCILIVVNVTLTSSKADVPCPNQICVCVNSTATCQGRISYIPPLPSKTTELVFSNNYLPSISRNTFANITNLKLNTLLLSRCAVQNITSDALYSFDSTLERLDLTGNTGINKQQLSSSLGQVRRIKVLVLNQINMEHHLNLNFFEGMKKSELKEIHLQNNKFQNISDKAFREFKYLKYIDLSHNTIHFVELSGLVPLTNLELNINKLFNVPEFCVNGTSKFPNITVIRLENNFIDVLIETSWSCLTSLEELYLDGNSITSLDDNVFSQLKRLNKLYLQSMKLENISSFAFNNSNLKSLYLSGCNIKFRRYNFDYSNIFRWCPDLRVLALDSNNLRKLNVPCLMSMFSTLKNLTNLKLQRTNFRLIPADLFKPLISLKQLDLSLNSISKWPVTLFSNVSKLKTLIMANNKIKVIKEGYFPSSLMEHLTILDLSGNPFDCSCENLWLRKWMNNIMRKKPNIFYKKYPNEYHCATPSRLQGTLLESYNPTDEDCRTWSHILMDIIIISSTVVIVFTCVALVYIQRWNIRYVLHTIYMRRKKYTLLRDTDFQYDIYVAYSDKDRSWVRNELWTELGQKKGFKLYIRDKSEDPGVAKCDSIINNMYDSRKVLLVISSNFMSCPWCLYQLQVAQGRAVHAGSDWLIPVVLGDLQIRHVTKSLHVLLKQENVITWSEEENGKILFWSKILTSMETSVYLNTVIEDNSLIVN